MAKINTIIGGLRIALQTLSAKMGVTLRIEGSQAKTDGETIIIPTLPPDDHDAAVLARGYVDHESGHIQESDFARTMGDWGTIIEEVYIERKQCDKFPGCAINLRELMGMLKVKKGSFRGREDDPMSLLTSWALCRGRANVLQQPLGDIADESEALSRKILGDDFCDKFEACVTKIGDCDTLDDCVTLGKEIEALVHQDRPPQQQESPNQSQNSERHSGQNGSASKESGQNSENGKQEAAEGSDKSEGSNSGATQEQSGSDKGTTANNQDASGEPDTGQETPDYSTGGKDSEGAQSSSKAASKGANSQSSSPNRDKEQEGNGAGGSSEKPTPEQQKNIDKLKDSDVSEASENMELGKLIAGALQDKHSEGFREDNLEEIPNTDVISSTDGNPGERIITTRDLGIDEARRKTSMMRSRLAGLLQSARLQHSRPKMVGHRIDNRAIYRIACQTPDTRLFSSKAEEKDDNTAVVLLKDRSGSMRPPRINIAIQATFVTAEALELLPRVTCAVGAFPWGDDILEMKAFGAKPQAERFNVTNSGDTPMDKALLWAGMLLTHRPEKRKIVIPMTDGIPDDVAKTIKAVERLKACGIEVYGIGILDDSITRWLEESEIIHDIEKLPEALIGLLKEALVNRRKMA